MKNHFFTALALLFLSNLSFSQEADLSNLNIISLEDKTAQNPYDFEPLKELLTDKRIILLGEQTHGDGATFDAKVELIKFLHSELGFDIVAFESPMFEIYKANQLSEDLKSDNDLVKESVFSIWSDTKQFQELLEYRMSTIDSDHPLEFAGFDFQEGYLFREYFFGDIKHLFNENHLSLEDSTIEVLKETFFGGSDFIVNSQEDSAKFYSAVAAIRTGFQQCNPENSHSKILQQSFESYMAVVEWHANDIMGIEYKVQNPRDLQMAKNLIFLTELYPDNKIIGWGASYHFANEVEKYHMTDLTRDFMKELSQDQNDEKDEYSLDDNLEGAIPMGKILKDHFGDQLYSIAFSSFDGTYGFVGQKVHAIPTPPIGSIEHAIDELGFTPSFINYAQFNSKEFYSSPLGYLPILAPWKDIFDGLFYIKSAYPPDYIEYKEANLASYQAGKSIRLLGRVIDQKTKKGVPYAHISIENSSLGTVSNGEGNFSFNVADESHLDRHIIVSSIGYKSKSFQVSSESLETDSIMVSLIQETTLLNEVVISEEFLSAKQIVKKARKRITENYYQDPYNQEMFYRVQHKLDDSITFKEESSILLYNDGGYKPSANATRHWYGQVLQFRDVIKNPKEYIMDGSEYLWLIFSHDLILDKNNVLYKTSFYNVELTNIMKYNGEEVYEISFFNKRPSSYTTGYGYPAPKTSKGKLFINVNDFAILRYEHCVERKPTTMPRKNPKYEIENWFIKNIQTYKKYNDHYFIHHSKQIITSDKIDTKSQKPSFTLGSREILSTRISTNSVIALEKPLGSIAQEKNLKNDPDFWNNHNVTLEDNDELDICRGR